jgi:RNA polymerase sigma-70 factor (sigma-E family)
MRGPTVDVQPGEATTAASAHDEISALYAAVTPRFVRLAYLLTADQGFAEDVVQEAFIKVASRLGRLRDPNAVGAYLRRAVVNEVLGSRRSLARQARREAAAHAAQRTVPEAPTDRVDQRIDLVEALNKLPLRQRTAILLRYWMDLSDADIAEAMSCPVGTVKSTLARGIEALRKAADRDG